MTRQKPPERAVMAELVAIRKARGMKQGEVAEAAGLSTAAISILENGHRGPLLDTIVRYAAAVGATIHATVEGPA